MSYSRPIVDTGGIQDLVGTLLESDGEVVGGRPVDLDDLLAGGAMRIHRSDESRRLLVADDEWVVGDERVDRSVEHQASEAHDLDALIVSVLSDSRARLHVDRHER